MPSRATSIYSNYGIGIDLGGDGVTQNTPGGPHSGANDLQNFPVITSAAASASATAVSGTLNSAPTTTYRLEFFGSPGTDPTGYGQGRVYIGPSTVTTDGSGNGSFNAVLPQSIPLGWFVSATATDPTGNTSEFAQDVIVPQLNVGLLVTLGSERQSGGHWQHASLYRDCHECRHRPRDGRRLDGRVAGVADLLVGHDLDGHGDQFGGNTVTGTVGTLAGGASVTLTITVQAAAVSSFNDLVSATSTVGVSGSASVSTQITKKVPIVSVATTNATPTYGQSTAFTATVSAAGVGAPTPTGTVKFVLDGVTLDQSIPLVNGVATSDIASNLLAGGHTIAVTYSGDTAYSSVVVPTSSFTVAKVHLTVTANNQSRGLDKANPTFTYTITGFVNGDTATVVSGAPALSTTATLSSPAGLYPITVGVGTLSAINYDFPNLVNGSLAIRTGTPLDFQGVGHAEIAVFWPKTAQWFGIGPTGGFSIGTFGATGLTDIPAPGDYDSTGKAEMAVFRPSTEQWFVMGPTGGRILGTFGQPGDIPVPGDYDGLGHTELAVFRPSNAHWYVLGPSGIEDKGAFGAPNLGDIPVPGDYDGVGHSELAVFRPSNSHWYVLGLSGAEDKGVFGAPNLQDIPVPGDYDGVGHAELAVFRPTTGEWFVMSATGGQRIGITGVAVPPDLPAGSPTGMLILEGAIRSSSLHSASISAPRTVNLPQAPQNLTVAIPIDLVAAGKRGKGDMRML